MAAYEIKAGENLLIEFSLYKASSGWTYRGLYDSGTAYVIDDVVQGSDDIIYHCILGTTGNDPPNATYWEVAPSIPVTDVRFIYADLFKDGIVGPSWNYASGSTQTNGTLVVGRKYIIATYNSGDDFTNVGAASNATGVIFIATGDTPATWTNSSVLNWMNSGPSVGLTDGLLVLELLYADSAKLDGLYELRLFLSTTDTDYIASLAQTDAICYPDAIDVTPC